MFGLLGLIFYKLKIYEILLLFDISNVLGIFVKI